MLNNPSQPLLTSEVTVNPTSRLLHHLKGLSLFALGFFTMQMIGVIGLIVIFCNWDHDYRSAQIHRLVSEPQEKAPFFDMQGAETGLAKGGSAQNVIAPTRMTTAFIEHKSGDSTLITPTGAYLAPLLLENGFAATQYGLWSDRLSSSYQLVLGDAPAITKSYTLSTKIEGFEMLTKVLTFGLLSGTDVAPFVPKSIHQVDRCKQIKAGEFSCMNRSGSYSVKHRVIDGTNLITIEQKGQAPLYLF